MKKCIDILIVFCILFALSLLIGCDEEPQETGEEPEGGRNMEKLLKDPKRNQKFIYTDKYSLSVEPILTGHRTDITIIGRVVREKKVEEILLLEDGKEIAHVREDFLHKEVFQKEEGGHTYFAKLTFTEGDEVETEKIVVQFLGKEMDFLPYISSFSTHTKKAGKWNVVAISAKDIGDNRGIRRIVLFEDGEPIEEIEDYNFLSKRIGHESKESHRYYGEVEDKGGHIVGSEEVEVEYSGQPFPPKIRWVSIRPEDRAGRNARIIVEAKDEDNFPRGHGIEEIILYEDGKPISKVRGESWLLAYITHDEKGEHTYWAEVKNQDGKGCTSARYKLLFEGEDFPPEITRFSTRMRESNRAVIIVEATDEKNMPQDKGIVKTVLYEDGQPVVTTDYYILVEEIVHSEEGVHRYFAEVVNASGLVARTKEVSLRFKP